MRINIFGASGSGCSSIGRALAESLQAPFFDSDDFYWQKTNPPFTAQAAISDRNRRLLAALHQQQNWVLAGSVGAWGIAIETIVSLVVFVDLPHQMRMTRLKNREQKRYGARIGPGGDMYEASQHFLEWSSHYESGHLPGRTRAKHEAWFQSLTCNKAVIHNTADLDLVVSGLVSHPSFRAAQRSDR